MCGVHRRTSSDWGKGLSSSWLYTVNTVLYISPTILWSKLNRGKSKQIAMQESQKEQKQKNNLSPLLITPLYDLTTTTLQSFKCSHIIVYSTSPLIRPFILQCKSVFSWGRQFGSIYLSVYEIWPDKRSILWWEWPYNMGTTTGFNEMIRKGPHFS